MRVRTARPSFDQARAIVADASPIQPAERMSLLDSLGLILSEDVRALEDYPRFDASAMDGFAFRAACCSGASDRRPVELALLDEIRAGGTPKPLQPGFARPISTGAPMCAGADTVLVAENAQVLAAATGTVLRVTAPVPLGRNVRSRGEDARAGETVLRAGTRICASAVGALTCYGITTVTVRRPPVLGLLTTGDELAPAGSPLSEAQIHDSNGPMLEALCRQAGLPVSRIAASGDNDALIHERLDTLILKRGLRIIASTGGASVGSHDRIAAVLAARGARIHFHGVNMRPGKPVIFATLPGGELFFGLPGNPVAAFLGFRFLVMSAVRRMLGASAETGELVETDQMGRDGTTVLLKAKQNFDENGHRRLTVLSGQQSHMLRPLLIADSWLAIEQRQATLFPLESDIE